jgi:hypothetical protein
MRSEDLNALAFRFSGMMDATDIPVPADVRDYGARHGLEEWAAATYRAGYADCRRAEVAAIRRAWLRVIQEENGCVASGVSCSPGRCGCVAEQAILIKGGAA